MKTNEFVYVETNKFLILYIFLKVLKKLSNEILKETENVEKTKNNLKNDFEKNIKKEISLLRLNRYYSINSMHSDHRPVGAQFLLNFGDI